jgi:hypothetical protein
MSEFSTEATVNLVLEERSLRQARDQLEESFSDVPVGVAGSSRAGRPPEMRSDGGGMSNRERRRRRREFRWARERTETIDEILEAVRGLEMGGGGGAGGLLDDVVGVAGEAGGALAAALPSAIGSAVGTAVGQAVSNSTLSVDSSPLDVEDPGTVDIEDPSWRPLEVREPGWDIGVDAPEEIATEDLSPLEVSDPSPLSVETPTLPVEDVGPIAVEVSGPASGSRAGDALGGLRGPPQSGGEMESITDLPADTSVPGPGPFETILDTASFGAQQGAAALMAGPPIGPIAGAIGGGALGGAGGAISYSLRFGSSILGETTDYGRTTNGGASRRPTVTNDVTVDHSPTYRVVVEPRLKELTNDIVDAIEDEVRDDLDTLEDDIGELRSDLDGLEQDLRRSGR